MKKMLVLFLFVATMLLTVTPSHAVLLKRGYGLVYDTDLDITILDFSYPSQGFIDAHLWAKDLVVYVGFIRVADWRLPKLITACTGYACRRSELGHIWYTELKNKGWYTRAGVPNPDGGFHNSGPFQNLYPEAYWLGPKNQTLLDRSLSWGFHMDSGGQERIDFEYQASYGIAVRSGDVALLTADTRDDEEEVGVWE